MAMRKRHRAIPPVSPSSDCRSRNGCQKMGYRMHHRGRMCAESRPVEAGMGRRQDHHSCVRVELKMPSFWRQCFHDDRSWTREHSVTDANATWARVSACLARPFSWVATLFVIRWLTQVCRSQRWHVRPRFQFHLARPTL